LKRLEKGKKNAPRTVVFPDGPKKLQSKGHGKKKMGGTFFPRRSNQVFLPSMRTDIKKRPIKKQSPRAEKKSSVEKKKKRLWKEFHRG